MNGAWLHSDERQCKAFTQITFNSMFDLPMAFFPRDFPLPAMRNGFEDGPSWTTNRSDRMINVRFAIAQNFSLESAVANVEFRTKPGAM